MAQWWYTVRLRSLCEAVSNGSFESLASNDQLTTINADQLIEATAAAVR